MFKCGDVVRIRAFWDRSSCLGRIVRVSKVKGNWPRILVERIKPNPAEKMNFTAFSAGGGGGDWHRDIRSVNGRNWIVDNHLPEYEIEKVK